MNSSNFYKELFLLGWKRWCALGLVVREGQLCVANVSQLRQPNRQRPHLRRLQSQVLGTSQVLRWVWKSVKDQSSGDQRLLQLHFFFSPHFQYFLLRGFYSTAKTHTVTSDLYFHYQGLKSTWYLPSPQ